jgi:hypothetical protein
MSPLSRVIQRRLLAAGIVGALALAPLSVAAAGGAQVDALWNQQNGVSVDSAYYVVQTWWDGLTHGTQTDPTQRGLDELAQANTDLLNAYTLLQRQRTDPGPQPVAIIDPLLSSIYNVVTGSDVKAPIGSVFDWANQGLLKLEGRGTTSDIIRSLMQDYRAKQASAMRDLPAGQTDTAALVAANAQRESAFLLTIKSVATPADGLAGLLDAADQSTIAVAGKASGKVNDTGKDNSGKGLGGNPKGPAKPEKKK